MCCEFNIERSDFRHSYSSPILETMPNEDKLLRIEGIEANTCHIP